VFEYKTLSTYINVLLRSTLSQLPTCIWSDYSSLLRQCVISINCQYIIIDISNHSLYTMKIKPFSECLHLRFFTDHFPFRRSSSDTSRRRLAHEIWKHLRRRPTSAVHDRFKTSGIGWPMTYVSYGRSLCGTSMPIRTRDLKLCLWSRGRTSGVAVEKSVSSKVPRWSGPSEVKSMSSSVLPMATVDQRTRRWDSHA
jgi:hypothetical protein